MSAKKRIISVILSFAMVIGMCATTFAAESIPDIAGVTQEDYMKELEDTIKGYIDVCEINTSDLSMSQPIPINGSNDENNRAIFLFSGTKCIALMMFTYVNNEYASSFSEGDYVEITEALNKNQSIALVSFEECMVMFTDDSWELIDGNEDFVQEAALNKARVGYEKQTLNLTPIAFSDEDAMYSSRSISEKTLPVTKVLNKTSPDTGRGLCWAASMVSIIRYRAGQKNLTIDALYDSLKEKYPLDTYGYPLGTTEWVKRCYSLYNLSYTYKSNGANFNTVKSIIEDNRPIYASLVSTDNEGHAVVIAGYEITDRFHYYIIMDPNIKREGSPTFVYVSLSSTTSTSFTYNTTYSVTYNNWRYSFY